MTRAILQETAPQGANAAESEALSGSRNRTRLRLLPLT